MDALRRSLQFPLELALAIRYKPTPRVRIPIDELFFLPPMAVARLGGSPTPVNSFTWVEDPSLQGSGLTIIAPAVTLQIVGDGSITPFLPTSISFRDGELLRPVAPFFELWLRSGSKEQPVTLGWLDAQGATLADIQFTIVATNAKASRRTGDPSCAFGARAQFSGDDFRPQPLMASSVGANPLVFASSPIPLGHVQVIRPTRAVALGVDTSVVRVRFIPARGEIYGPPSAQEATEPDANAPKRRHELVPGRNRILNPNATWLKYDASNRFMNPEPADTYDGSDDSSRRNESYGVVDDTCDVILRAALTIQKRVFTASARAFSAPTDFAPDRRPFVSVAEDLSDRDAGRRENAEPLPDAVERLGDLFQRIFETVSLTSVDMIRDAMLPARASGPANPPDLPAVNRESMTPHDPLFDKNDDLLSPPSSHERLPYSSVAQQVHGGFADTEDLVLFLRTNADRIRRLIRPAYPHFRDFRANPSSDQHPDASHRDPRILRDTMHDMRMPPYMRDSDATPLSLNRRQYDFVMNVLDRLQPRRGKVKEKAENIGRVEEHVARVTKRRAARKRS